MIRPSKFDPFANILSFGRGQAKGPPPGERGTPLRDYVPFRRWFLCAVLATLCACAGSEQKAYELAAESQSELEGGRLIEARQSILAALKERDDLAPLFIQKARIELAAKAYPAAFAAYSEANALDATNLESLLALAQLGLSLGYEKEARDASERLLVLQPSDPNVLMIAGLLALEERKPDEAEGFARRILSQNAADERGLVLQARTQFFRGDRAAAVATLRGAKGAGAGGEATAITLLELYRNGSDASGMLEQFRRLRVSRPDDLRLRLDEANVRFKNGDMTGARALLQDVLARPAVPQEVVRRAILLWQAYGQGDGGPADAARVRSSEARHSLARALLVAGDARSARIMLGQARTRADDGLLSRIQLAAGDARGAAITAERVLREDETQCDALLTRAAVRVRARDAAGGVAAAQRAVAECPDEGGGYLELAAVNRARGNVDEEFRAFDAGLEANPQDLAIADAYFNRALQLRRAALAMGIARRFTRAAPAVPAGWKMLARACALAGDEVCSDQARAGLQKAASDFRLQPLPGEPPANGVFGRLQQ